MSHKAAERTRQERRIRAERTFRTAARRHRIRRGAWVVGALAVAGLVTAMLLNSQPESSTATRVAPGFTLTDTAGDTVRLSDYRGTNVLLYFSEGAGCQSCLVQMREIEKDAKAFTDAGITVLPIVMNTRSQITQDMATNDVTTPFLLDDGTVSRAYGTLGKGMHAGLPGHSFVLVDKSGRQRWYAEYPSMWRAPQDLLRDVQQRVAG